jgi:hypothetical protein
VCQQGTILNEQYLKTKITTKKSLLESVKEIIRQKPAKASGDRQQKKVDYKMTGMGIICCTELGLNEALYILYVHRLTV